MEVFSSHEPRVQGPTRRPAAGTPLAELCEAFRQNRSLTRGELRSLRSLEMLTCRWLGRPALWGDLDDPQGLEAFLAWLVDSGRSAEAARHYHREVIHRLQLFAGGADRQGGAKCSY